MKDPQQTADELVEMYSWIPSTEGEDDSLESAIDCAILHTQGIINELREVPLCPTVVKKLSNHQQVLTILKTRL
jgi:hypothetical protein